MGSIPYQAPENNLMSDEITEKPNKYVSKTMSLQFRLRHCQNPKIVIGYHHRQMLLIYQMNMSKVLLLVNLVHCQPMKNHDPSVQAVDMVDSKNQIKKVHSFIIICF